MIDREEEIDARRHGAHDDSNGPEILEFLIYNDRTDQLATFGMPAVAGIGFFLHLIAVLTLKKSKLTTNGGSLYKYLYANSLFDMLVMYLLTFKPLVKHILTESIFALFLFCYLSSVTLTCSKFTRIVCTLDQLTKCMGKWRYVFKRWLHARIIFFYTFLSLVINFPIISHYWMYDITWFKQTYFEQTLNVIGFDSWLGIFGMLNAMFINLSQFVIVISLNGAMKKADLDNLKKLVEV